MPVRPGAATARRWRPRCGSGVATARRWRLRCGSGAAALLAAGLLTGCGGSSPGGPAATRPPAVERTVTAVPSPPSTTASGATGATAVPARVPHGDPPRPGLPADLAVRFAGEGARGAWVLRRRADAHDPVVVFLHGWTAVSPTVYGPWLAHLVRRGATVVYPIYQDAPFLAPGAAFGDMVAGVRAALRDARPRLSRKGWVLAGHSAGGALSADYAARAAALGLPAARAVFAAYPGRMIRGIPLRLPEEADPASIPAGTRLVALYSPGDETVGATTALRTYRRATRTRRTLVRVTDPAVEDHRGPQRAGLDTQRIFWSRLDRLVDDVQQ